MCKYSAHLLPGHPGHCRAACPGVSVFDGLHHVLVAWVARYINVFLWLPVANIFGSLIGQIQEQMIKIDIQQLQATGQTAFGSTDAAYLVFLILGIVGYFTVPTITNHIIMVFPVGGAHLAKVTNEFESATTTAIEAPVKMGKAVAGMLQCFKMLTTPCFQRRKISNPLFGWSG